MSSETIALSTVGADARPIGERLHDWIVTVDHKKLGIMYILYALFFLLWAASKPSSCAYS